MSALNTPATASAPRRTEASRARRAARRERRRARRQRMAIAGVLLGGLGLAGLAGLYNGLGRDPAPLPLRMALSPAMGPPPAGTWRPAPARVLAPAAKAMPAAAPGAVAQAAAPAQVNAPATTAATTTATTTATAATAACARPPCLPYIVGAQVIDDGGAAASGDQPLSRSWAATLSSSQPMDQVVAYYRQQLTLMQGPGDAPVNESHPGPNQLLLTMTASHDRAHQSVWIGQAGPQVLIRLVRSLPATP